MSLRRKKDESKRRSTKKSSRRSSTADSSNGKTCSVRGCTQPHHARGYCKKHYGEIRRAESGAKSGSGKAESGRKTSRSDTRSKRAAKGHTRGKMPDVPEPIVADVTMAADTVDEVEEPRDGSRLEEIRRRYEHMKREIARIAETFDSEVESDVDEDT
jgi:hypothetical protein